MSADVVNREFSPWHRVVFPEAPEPRHLPELRRSPRRCRY
jgi:hypothetical protein